MIYVIITVIIKEVMIIKTVTMIHLRKIVLSKPWNVEIHQEEELDIYGY